MSSDTPRRDIIDAEMAATSDAQHLVRLHDEYGIIERELATATAERDSRCRQLAACYNDLESVIRARNEVLAQLAAARLDSRRIDALEAFIKDGPLSDIWFCPESGEFVANEGTMEGKQVATAPTLRAAIDALPTKQQEDAT